MARYLRSGIAVLLLVCFVSQACCHLETVKVLNHGDRHEYPVCPPATSRGVIDIKKKYSSLDCGSLLKAGYNVSGVYRLALNRREVQIPCEFVGGQAFIIILRRMSNALSFIQPWKVYNNGFGNPWVDYWAGLANIYLFTLNRDATLRIIMTDWSQNTKYAFYQGFYLDQQSTGYRMHVGAFNGTLKDDLSYNNNRPFFTYDAPDPSGCATNMKAGWWYNYCTRTLPTGKYYSGGWYKPPGNFYDGIYWKDWHGFNYSAQYFSMALLS